MTLFQVGGLMSISAHLPRVLEHKLWAPKPTMPVIETRNDQQFDRAAAQLSLP